MKDFIEKIEKSKILNSNIALLVGIFILYVPYTVIGWLSNTYIYIYICIIRVLFYLVIFIKLVIFIRKNKRIPLFIICLIIYELYIVINTCLNEGSLTYAFNIRSDYSWCALLLLITLEIENRNKEIFELLSIYSFFYIALNLICVCKWPNATASYLYWPLGVDNQHLGFFVFGMLSSVLNSMVNKKYTFLPFLIYIVEVMTVLITKSSTAIICLTTIGTLLMIELLSKSKSINIANVEIVYVILVVSIVFLRVQNHFGFIFEFLFDKDATFTMRTAIWDIFLKKIRMKPVFGYGFRDNCLDVYHIYTNTIEHFYAHNMVLDQLYCGGVFLVCIHSFLWINSAYQLMKKCRNSYTARIIACFFFALTLGYLMEIYEYFYLFFMYMICFEAKYFINDIN